MRPNKVKVKIEWQGSKVNNLPTGLKYVAVAKFEDSWLGDAWSIVLEFTTPPSEQDNPSEGVASFWCLMLPPINLLLELHLNDMKVRV